MSALLKPSVKWILALAFINAAGLYTQYAYPFIMLAQGVIVVVWLLAVSRPIYRSMSTTEHPLLGTFILANLLAILLYLPWLPTALRQVTQWPSTGAPIAAGEALGIIGGWFTLGITYTVVPNASGYQPLALLLLAGGLVGWMWLSPQRRWSILVPLIWAGLPVVLFLLLGLFRPANLKFLLPAQIGFALLLGAGLAGWWGLARRGYRSDRFTLAFTLVQGVWLLAYLVNSLQPLYADPHFQRADYRAMVHAIMADPRAGDAIVLDAPNQEEVFRYYYHGSAPVYPLPAGLGGDDAATLAQVREIIADHQRIFVLFWGEAERDPQRIVEATLDNETFAAGDDHWYGDVRLARYVTPVQLTETTTANARFGDSIVLEHFATSARSLQAGEVLQVRLEWRTETALTTRYKVFVQLLNSGGVLVAQRDSEPAGNSAPTNSWQVGESIIDQHGLLIPADLVSGQYQVIIGLYNSDDPTQRLAVHGRDYLQIGYVSIGQ